MKKIYLLGAVPPAVNVVGACLSQSARPYIAGMPFMLAWVVGSVLLTAVVMQLIYWVDTRSSHRASRLASAAESGSDLASGSDGMSERVSNLTRDIAS